MDKRGKVSGGRWIKIYQDREILSQHSQVRRKSERSETKAEMMHGEKPSLRSHSNQKAMGNQV